jgi:bifunctional DNase/RNase
VYGISGPRVSSAHATAWGQFPEDEVNVRLLALQIDPTTCAAVILLGEADAPSRVLPIVIGSAEAESIALTVSEVQLPRPMTHDLFVNALHLADAQIAEVAIVALRAHTFFAELRLDTVAGARRVDARPSDAIALAVRVEAPIVVDDAVFLSASVGVDREPDLPFSDTEIDQIVSHFRQQLDMIEPTDFADERDEPE